MELALTVALSAMFSTFFVSGWLNDWDRLVEFRCPLANQTISDIQSKHRNSFEDRRFSMGCTSLPGNYQYFTKCNWTGLSVVNCTWTWYINSFDGYHSLTVPSGRILSGVSSYFNSHHNDRRWKYRTCNVINGIF